MDIPNMLALYWLHARFLTTSSKREVIMRDEPHPNLGTKELDEADYNRLSD